jgi:hypothetical protein
MTKISQSPERHTFQLEVAKRRAAETGKEVPEHWVENMTSAREQDRANMADPAWAEYNLEYDLRTTDWILAKVRASDNYAQNLYAAMCNNDFQRLEVYPILANQVWSCSWRHAGGIISDMRESGDYIDWYCSGISSQEDGYGLDGHVPEVEADGRTYVPEGEVTQEIESDLQRLGWRVIKSEE